MYLKEETKKHIERTVGKSIEEIQAMTLDEEIAYIEEKIGKKLEYPKRVDHRRVAYGNTLITKRRLRTLGEADEYIRKSLERKLP